MAISTTSISATALPGTVTYTSSGNTALTFMSVCNHTGLTVTCDIHVVPSGGTAGTGNLFVDALEITAGNTYVVYQGNEKLLFENGDRIEVVSSALASLTVITSYTAV